MIASPHNDHECLLPATEQVIAAVEAHSPALVELAERFGDTDALAAWFRTLPQRDDDGDPADGPKVAACRPPQRLNFENPSPNCFERACRFSGAAELIDPDRVYRLATVETPSGLHTFPTRDGEPVVLDPLQSRNALKACLANTGTAPRRLRLERLIGTDETRGVRGDLARARRAKELGQPTWVDGGPIDDAIASYERALAHFRRELDALPRDGKAAARNAAPVAPVVLTPAQAVDWLAELAMERAARFDDGPRRVQSGHIALRGVLALRPICVSDVRDVVFLLALAEREARGYGWPGLQIAHSTVRAIDALDRMAADRWLADRAAHAEPRNAGPFELRIGGRTLRPDVPLLGSLAKVGGRIAGNIGLEALRLKLASLGVGPPVLQSVERELNREGLSLGPLAAPSPILGSLSAMTPEALAGRWLAGKL